MKKTAMATGPLAASLQARVRELAQQVGDVEAARLLGVARSTVTRAATGLSVRPSVAIAIETMIGRIGSGGAS